MNYKEFFRLPVSVNHLNDQWHIELHHLKIYQNQKLIVYTCVFLTYGIVSYKSFAFPKAAEYSLLLSLLEEAVLA